MYNRHSFAPFGAAYGRRHPFIQSHFRAPVNVYKAENSYELMVFAPGRVKENFSVNQKEMSLPFHIRHRKDYPLPTG
jgi:HSP20 family protein